MTRWLYIGHGGDQGHRLWIAQNEVKDAGTARIESRADRRPRGRALRRNRGCQPLKATHLPKPVQVRQGVPMLFEEAGIHRIDAQNDDAFSGRRLWPRAARYANSGDQSQCEFANILHASSDFPSIHWGTATPNNCSAVGARSSIPGSGAFTFRFEKRTPGTNMGSTQWSPLQAKTLDRRTNLHESERSAAAENDGYSGRLAGCAPAGSDRAGCGCQRFAGFAHR